MSKLTRRSVLAAAAALAAKPAGAIVFHPATGAGASPPHGNLTAEITFPGGSPVAGTLVFDQSTATDMGDYVAPTAGFTQHCYRARNVSLPNFFVDFRPDAVGGRIECVFWNGEIDPVNLTIPSGYIRDLPPYNVNIKQSGVSIFTISIGPVHYWATRWRYKSADRPAIRTGAQVMSDGFIAHMSLHAARASGNNVSTGQPWSGQPYSGVIVPGAPLPSSAGTTMPTYTPFMPPGSGAEVPTFSTTVAAPANAGDTSISISSPGASGGDRCVIRLSNGFDFTGRVSAGGGTVSFGPALPASVNAGAAFSCYSTKLGYTQAVEQGGERPELGHITEFQADWILNARASSYTGMMQQAEMAAAEWPFFLPDVTTSTALNNKQSLKHYKTQISGNLILDYSGSYTFLNNGWQFSESTSHFANIQYIPWAATEDPYLAEAWQYMVAYSTADGGAALGKLAQYGQGEVGWGNLTSDPTGLTGFNGAYTCCSHYDEVRSVGNGVRNVAAAYKMALVSPPSWLQPKSYFAALGRDFSKVIDSVWGPNTIYTTPGSWENVQFTMIRTPASSGYAQAFEQAYAIMAMCLADLIGMPGATGASWITLATYFFDQFDAMYNGAPGSGTSTRGWNRQTPQPHDIYFWPHIGAAETLAQCQTGKTCLDLTAMASWADYYTGAEPALKFNATNPTAAFPGNQQGGSMGNTNMIYAACAYAKSRGIAAASGAMDYISMFIDYNWPTADLGIGFEWKCGFDGT